jgi:hypothetical protein
MSNQKLYDDYDDFDTDDFEMPDEEVYKNADSKDADDAAEAEGNDDMAGADGGDAGGVYMGSLDNIRDSDQEALDNRQWFNADGSPDDRTDEEYIEDFRDGEIDDIGGYDLTEGSEGINVGPFDDNGNMVFEAGIFGKDGTWDAEVFDDEGNTVVDAGIFGKDGTWDAFAEEDK